MLFHINGKNQSPLNLQTITEYTYSKSRTSSLTKKKLNFKKKIQQYSFLHSELIASISTYTKSYKGINHITNETVEIKVVDIKNQNKNHLEMVHNEYKIMRKLKHQNIIELKDVHMTNTNLYIITEYCNQGNLANYLKKQIRLNQYVANEIIIQILKGYQELYRKNIVHCNLTLQNIFIHNNIIKIGGFSYAFDNNQNVLKEFQKEIHQKKYSSPEVLTKVDFSFKSDIFSIGIIYYQLLHGYKPWNQNIVQNLLIAYQKQQLRFGPSCKISEKQKNFIIDCLKMNKDERITIKKIFQQQLFTTLKRKCKVSIISDPNIIQQSKSIKDQPDQYQLKTKILKCLGKNKKQSDQQYHRINRFYTKPTLKFAKQFIKQSNEKNYIALSQKKFKSENSQGRSLSKGSPLSADQMNQQKSIIHGRLRNRFLSNNLQINSKKIEMNQKKSVQKIKQLIINKPLLTKQFHTQKQFIEYLNDAIECMNEKKCQFDFKRLFDKVIYVLQKIKSVLIKKNSSKIISNDICDPYLKIIDKQSKIQEVWAIGLLYFKRLSTMLSHTLQNCFKSNIYDEFYDQIIQMVQNLKNIERTMQKMIKNRKFKSRNENVILLSSEYNP